MLLLGGSIAIHHRSYNMVRHDCSWLRRMRKPNNGPWRPRCLGPLQGLGFGRVERKDFFHHPGGEGGRRVSKKIESWDPIFCSNLGLGKNCSWSRAQVETATPSAPPLYNFVINLVKLGSFLDSLAHEPDASNNIPSRQSSLYKSGATATPLFSCQNFPRQT